MRFGGGSKYLRATIRRDCSLLRLPDRQHRIAKRGLFHDGFDNKIRIACCKNGVANGVSSSNIYANGRYALSTGHSMLMFISPS